MNTNDEQQECEKKLSAAGFAVDGIDHTDAAVMTEVYKTLGFNPDRAYDIPVKTRVRSFIIKASRKEESGEMKEEVKEIVEYVRAAKTEKKDMSKASSQWAQELVGAMGIVVKTEEPDKGKVPNTKEPTRCNWHVMSAAGKTVPISKHQGTPGAREWFQSHFLSGDELESQGYICKVVTCSALPKLKAGGKGASGKGDMVIGKATDMALALSVYEQVPGLIELKTEEYPIKVGQIILELTAFSQASRFGRGVVLLWSDCNTKWGLAWFQNYNTISRRSYSSGRKCWMDFKEMLLNADDRATSMEPPLKKHLAMPKEAGGNDEDQNLDGFEDKPGRKQTAVDNEAYLNQLANFLGDMYGERPVVPEWAKAKNIVPDYYA